jgi:hypothetical protein
MSRMNASATRALLLVIAGVTGFTLVARSLGYKLGTRTIVRCRRGHLFTTIWIPGVKLKAVDLLVARIQRCPVGDHWSLVVPVRERDLSRAQRARARRRRDIRLP